MSARDVIAAQVRWGEVDRVSVEIADNVISALNAAGYVILSPDEVLDEINTSIKNCYNADGSAKSREYGFIANGLMDALRIVSASTHRHKKRGTEYTLIGIGKMQAENWNEAREIEVGHTTQMVVGPSVDMRECAIYRSVDDGSLWVRPREEYEDGRFEILVGAKHG